VKAPITPINFYDAIVSRLSI